MIGVQPRRLTAIARADLLERIRRPAFMVTLGSALWAASVFVPPADAPYATLEIGGHRGIYNSAWVGVVTAVLCSVFFSFVGFYLVRSTVDHDRRTGVGAILATTPMSRIEYTLAKWLANFGVLAAMVAVMAVGAAAMQLARGEDRHLDALAILAPFVWLVLPSMSIAAGLAVLFETTPGLGGGLGNAVFFFTWIFALAAPQQELKTAHPWMDPLGANLMITEMVRAAAAHFPDVRSHPDAYSIGLNFKTGGWHLTTFRWEGAAWTAAVIVPRLVWTGVGAMLAVFAALPFDRFAGEGPLREAGRGGSGRRARRSGRVGTPSAGVAVDATVAAPARGPFDAAASSDHPVLASPHRGRALPGLIAAELRLLLAGLPIAWYLVPLALVVASAFVPHVAAGRVAAIAWGWPVLRWSALGARDRRHGTEALLLSSPRPITRQLAASWIAGLVLALGMGAGVALRAALAGDLATLAGVVSGAAFVPALALALGTWTGSTKTFEVLYLVLWYGGPLNGIPFLDFTGGAGAGPAAGFAIAAALLLALAALGRQRRLLT